MKPTKCKMKQPGCLGTFIRLSIGHKTCANIFCALEQVRLDKAKRQRKADKATRERLKSRREWLKDCQSTFNTWVRKRDYGQPCISCGTTSNIQYCAGHYRTVGSCPELRFEPLNVHLQCNKNCNMEKSGNIIEYRINLIKKIGLDRVEWLEGYHPPAKWSVDDLKAIQAEYRAKIKELSNAN